MGSRSSSSTCRKRAASRGSRSRSAHSEQYESQAAPVEGRAEASLVQRYWNMIDTCLSSLWPAQSKFAGACTCSKLSPPSSTAAVRGGSAQSSGLAKHASQYAVACLLSMRGQHSRATLYCWPSLVLVHSYDKLHIDTSMLSKMQWLDVSFALSVIG